LYIDQQIQQDNQETNQQEITKRLTLICWNRSLGDE
jgi:hypothetical protein